MKEKEEFLINFFIPEIMKANISLNFPLVSQDIKNYSFMNSFYENVIIPYNK